MTQPVITLRQPVLDELRAMARAQAAADLTSDYLVMQGQALKMHTEGIFGEQIVCDYLCVDNPRRLMTTVDDYKNDDDVFGIQVRATTYDDGHLITHDKDKSAPYVLVTLQRVNYDLVHGTIRGWAWRHECNTPSHWRTHGPNGQPLRQACYMTPQTVLHPIDTLPIPNKLKGQICLGT